MKRLGTLVALLTCISGTAVMGWAQDGVITGRVADSSDAVLPGVTITLTSSQVMGERMQVSDERGNYRFTLLPPGAYALKFELPSFKTLIRDGIQMTTGFTATVNAALAVATVEGTLTVVGESPVVDLQNATVGTTFNAELSKVIPQTDWAAVLGVMPGVQVTLPDVGGSRAHIQPSMRSYGTTGQVWMLLDGVIANQASGFFSFYYDYGSLTEFKVSEASQGAEIPTAGPSMNFIVKSGSNRIHGSGFADYINKRWEGNNITDALRSQGVNSAQKRQRWTDLHGDLGGPFIKDKFWWYASTRYQYIGLYPFGFKNDDGTSGLFYMTLKTLTTKFNYQLTPKNTLTYTGFAEMKLNPQRNASSFVPYSSTGDQHYPGWTQKWQVTSTISPRITLESKVADYDLGQWKVLSHTNEISGRDLDTLVYRGSTFVEVGSPYIYNYRRWHTDEVLSVNSPGPGGNHNMRIGYGWLYDDFKRTNNSTPGDIVEYWRGGFKTPAFIDVLDTPVTTQNSMRQQWLFINDTWNVTRKLTLNLGFRYDRYVSYLPEQGKSGQGRYQAKVTIPRTMFPAMNGPVPRLSAAYDVFGNGRLAIKLGFSRYVYNPATNISNALNPLSLTTTRYTWDGTLPSGFPDVPYVPDPTKIVSVTGGANRTADPNLHLPHVDEYLAGLDQQIGKDSVFRLTFVRKFERDKWQNFNSAIPFSAYNIPVIVTDPGRDHLTGTADDQRLTVFNLDPAFRGLRKNLLVNNPDYSDGFLLYGGEFVKRPSNRWQMITGLDVMHFKSWAFGDGVASETSGVPQDPNSRVYNAGRNYWHWQYKLIGSYDLPKGMTVSSTFRALKGEPYGRTLNTPSLNQGVQTITVERVGSFFLPSYGLLDVQFKKTFKVENGKFDVMVSGFNLFNKSTVLGVNSLTGTGFGTVTSLMDPRVFKIGANYAF